MPSKFEEKLLERKRIESAAAAQVKTSKEHLGFDEHVPESPYERTEEQIKLDEVIDRVDILEAYRRWCGKMNPDGRRRSTEGIKISCPKPDHADKHPSAWINTDKGTWYCGGCQEGGDKFDIAAFGLNFPVPGYKQGAEFHKLREAMAESLGYRFHKPPGAEAAVLIAPESPAPIGQPTQVPGKSETSVAQPIGVVKSDTSGVSETDDANGTKGKIEEPGESSVTTIYDVLTDDEILWPHLDWKSIVPEDTFLWHYLNQTTIDDVAEEYHFWNGLIAIGFALGRDVRLFDRIPVFGNLNVCTLGHSGAGKSQAKYHLDNLLTAAMPHDWSDASSKGVKRISTPASAEVLVHSFSKPILDPTNPKSIAYYAPVRGLVDFNELSALVGRAERQGNVLKPTLMQFYDMEKVVSTASMTTGEKRAVEPFCTVLTTTQPRAIKKLIHQNDADSGFLNRWVFAAGPEKKRISVGGTIIDLVPAIKPLEDIVGWAGAGKTISWSDGALKRFDDFYHTVIEPTKRADESGLLTRLDLLMKKLILLFGANKHEDEISEGTVDSMILMWKYILDCYAIPSAQIGNSLAQEVREEVLRHAQRLSTGSGKGVSLNDLNKRLKRKKYPLDLIVKTLGYMVQLGELEIDNVRGPGRPTTRYRYVG